MADPPSRAPRLGRADAWAALAFMLAGLALYGGLALRLAEGRLYDYYNLAFDWDASRVLSMLTDSPPDGMGFKHPLMIALRPLGLGFMALGLAPKQAAGMTMALSGALTLGVVFLLLRACRIARPESAALALLFALSSTAILTAITTESYGFALLSLALVWLVARLRQDAPERLRAARYAAAVAAAGVTLTNVLQPVIAEAWQARRARRGVLGWVRHMVRYGVILGLAFAATAMLLWGGTILAALMDPLGTARAIWWLQTQGEKTGPLAVVESFLVFSFVAPAFTIVPLPEGTRMVDFRDRSFGLLGWAAALLWLALLAAGTLAALRRPGLRAFALPLLLALGANILFHVQYQYRGSLYIYASHAHLPAFLLAAQLAVVAQAGRWRGLHLGLVLLLAGLFAAVNLPLAADFATRFDVPDTPCPAPCS